MSHEKVIRQLFPIELGGDFDDDVEIEGKHLDDLQTNAEELHKEMFPDTTDVCIGDWERFLDITPPESATLQERRDAVIAKLREEGGLSEDYFINLADGLGYTITITGYTGKPFVFGLSRCNAKLGSQGSCWTWKVTTAGPGPIQELEDKLNDLKPADSEIIFVYT
jgi:uncharacterized protein YmfQ (DUF2313 family)